jgi:hypothetical protein
MNESALPTFRFPANTCIAQAQPQMMGAVTLASPGLDVMTFQKFGRRHLRQLGKGIALTEIASTFAEINVALA